MTTVTVPLTIVSTHGGTVLADAAKPLGVGPPITGDCGTARMSVRASNATYDLTLFSTQGVIGSGSYAVTTGGIGAVVPTPGSISGRDSTI